MKKKRLSIWGSTGSIGTQALEVIRQVPGQYKLVVLTAHQNAEQIYKQAMEFHPERVILTGEVDFSWHRRFRELGIMLETGPGALLESAASGEQDMVLNGLVGSAGLLSTVRAIEAGTDIALANKEVLVMAGDMVIRLVREKQVRLIPVDSEHSAIFQCLRGEPPESVRRLILTASGGPFRTRPADALAHVRVEEALAHPNWKMGARITVDSATLMNKALEIIEARWLFDVSPGQIEVMIHPQSILHSMIEFRDGSIKAQLSVPDMRVPIAYALSFPGRWEMPFGSLDLLKKHTLELFPPDLERFPALRLAYDVLDIGGTAPAVLNGADEAAVQAFISRRISFPQISECIKEALHRHEIIAHPSIEQVIKADQEARETVEHIIRSIQ